MATPDPEATPPIARRLRRVMVSARFLQNLLSNGHSPGVPIENLLPSSAVLVAAYTAHDNLTPVVALIFEHQSFSAIAEGGQIPELSPVFQQAPPPPDLWAALEPHRN